MSCWYLWQKCIWGNVRRCGPACHGSPMHPIWAALPVMEKWMFKTKCFPEIPDQILNENSSHFCVNRSIFVNDFLLYSKSLEVFLSYITHETINQIDLPTLEWNWALNFQVFHLSIIHELKMYKRGITLSEFKINFKEFKTHILFCKWIFRSNLSSYYSQVPGSKS